MMKVQASEHQNGYIFNPDTISKEEMIAFIGKNSSCYENSIDKAIARFEKKRTKDPSIDISYNILSFNPWAIVTTFTWFFYRKMYFLGIAVLLVWEIMDNRLRYHSHSYYYLTIIPVFFGEFLYCRYAIKSIYKFKQKLVKKNAVPTSEQEFFQLLSKKGGTSFVAGFLSIILYCVLFLVGAILEHPAAITDQSKINHIIEILKVWLSHK